MSIIPRIQRAFLSWLEETRHLSTVRIVTGRRTRRFLEFEFDVGGPLLSGCLLKDEIRIAACKEDYCWDFLLDLECFPARTDHGLVCMTCSPANRRAFSTREELWRDHLFDPLLVWINTELEPATAIAFHGRADFATWANLVDARGPNAHKTRNTIAFLESLQPLEPVPPKDPNAYRTVELIKIGR